MLATPSRTGMPRAPWPGAMLLTVPDPSLVLLVGPAGCGKSTLARAHFTETEVVSSDRCRALVADDETDQGATGAAFAVLRAIVDGRLAMRRLVVVDATNLQPHARAPLLELARRHHLPSVAVLLDVPEELCQRRNAARTERVVEPDVVARHWRLLADARRLLPAEGVQRVWRLGSEAEMDAATVAREPLPADRRAETGPFDLVGDVHGCHDELVELLASLGYATDSTGTWRHREGRRVVFLGDLVDRGPAVAAVLGLAMDMVERGSALCIPGNHDDKLMRKLQGRNVKIAHGLQESLDSLAERPRAFSRRVQRFLGALPSHLVLDGGRLVAAHGGMREELQGRESRRVRDFALYGDTTGEVDELGLPVRRDWASAYHGAAMVVYGHTPVAQPIWVHRTLNVDTGCVFGGRLTALRYPELELVSVPARRRYATSARPFPPPAPDGAAPEERTAV
jgi:protein phosphatase